MRRFFDVLTSPPLSAWERDAVAGWLSPDLAHVFFAQSDADQRHGYHAALVVVSQGFTDSDVVVAALMHDVGKRHADLGVIGRSVASVLIRLRLPLSRRMVSYRDHGLAAARELSSLNAPTLAIEFAEHHHASRPPTIDRAAWEVLQLSDQPPKTSSRMGREITSTVE